MCNYTDLSLVDPWFVVNCIWYELAYKRVRRKEQENTNKIHLFVYYTHVHVCLLNCSMQYKGRSMLKYKILCKATLPQKISTTFLKPGCEHDWVLSPALA